MDEITINIPITIDLDSAMPRVNVAGKPAADDKELDQNPMMINPLQQELELKKAALGKSSPVIDKLTADETIGAEPEQEKPDDSHTDFLQRIKALIGR